MVCPFCKSKGFVPTEEFSRPIKNLGGKECFNTVDYRRYTCLLCGRVFKTKEIYDCEIQVRVNNQLTFTDISADGD